LLPRRGGNVFHVQADLDPRLLARPGLLGTPAHQRRCPKQQRGVHETMTENSTHARLMTAMAANINQGGVNLRLSPRGQAV